jgi:hypothetical protein
LNSRRVIHISFVIGDAQAVVNDGEETDAPKSTIHSKGMEPFHRWLGSIAGDSDKATEIAIRNTSLEAAAAASPGIVTRTTATTAAAPPGEPDVFPYTTLLLIWSLHALYYLQRTTKTNQRSKRRRQEQSPAANNVPAATMLVSSSSCGCSYDDLVIRRRYEKLLWLALRTTTTTDRLRANNRINEDDHSSTTTSSRPQQQSSQHDHNSNNNHQEASSAGVELTSTSSSFSSSLTIPLGHTNPDLDGAVSPVRRTRRRRTTHQLCYQYAEYYYAMLLRNTSMVRCRRWLQQAVGGGSVLQLFYYTHLIWSCRALETHFGSSLQYLSSLFTVVALSISFRFGLIRYAVLQWETRSEIVLLRQDDQSGSPMRICIPIVVTFQLVFPHSAISVIPFFHLAHSNIVISIIALLLFVGWEGSFRELIEGVIVTYGWVQMGAPDVGPFVLLAVLALMSHRWLCDSVGWDRRTGQLQVYDDEARQWTPYEPYLDTEIEARTDYYALRDRDDYNDNDDNNSMAEDSSAAGSNDGHNNDREDYYENEQVVPLIANEASAVLRRSRNEVRSRRGGGVQTTTTSSSSSWAAEID